MSDASSEPMRELVEEYALGMLDAARRAEFEAALQRDPALQAEVAATLDAITSLAFSTPVTPAPELKQRVMANVAAATELRPAGVLPFTAPRRSRAAIWLGAALAASLLLVSKLTFELRDATHAAESARATMIDESLALASRDSMIAQLTDPASQLVTLAATGVAKPRIKAFFSHARHTMILSASQLDSLPAGRAYQLWFIVNGKPVPSVTFTADQAGHALLKDVVLPAGDVAAAAITEEPSGGSQAPTSPILFVGKLATE